MVDFAGLDEEAVVILKLEAVFLLFTNRNIFHLPLRFNDHLGSE